MAMVKLMGRSCCNSGTIHYIKELFNSYCLWSSVRPLTPIWALWVSNSVPPPAGFARPRKIPPGRDAETYVSTSHKGTRSLTPKLRKMAIYGWKLDQEGVAGL